MGREAALPELPVVGHTIVGVRYCGWSLRWGRYRLITDFHTGGRNGSGDQKDTRNEDTLIAYLNLEEKISSALTHFVLGE